MTKRKRRRRKIVASRLTPEVMDELIREMGAEFTGELPQEEEIVFTRRQLMIYDCIRKNPGVRRSDLEMVFGYVGHAINKLIRVGLIRKEKPDRTEVRYYPVGDGHEVRGKN